MDQYGQKPRTILITGASRGIGAEVATQLAGPKYHIVVNFREKAKRAIGVMETIQDAGGNASVAQADLTDEAAVRSMLDDVKRRFGGLDALVLNASGGMERDAGPDYAMRLNCDAQVSLATLALPLMPAGGRVVFVTSHLAHFYRRDPVPAEYSHIAASKRAGEDALRGMRPEFDRNGISLVVVSGDMVDGTVILRSFERRHPDVVAARRAVAPLPSVSEFASAIVGATREPADNGQTIYVGGPDSQPQYPS